MKFTWRSEICWPSSESITIREVPCSPLTLRQQCSQCFWLFASNLKLNVGFLHHTMLVTGQGGSSWEGFIMLQKPWTIVFKEEEIKRVHQYHVGNRRKKRRVYHVGKSIRRIISVWKEPVARKSLFKLGFIEILGMKQQQNNDLCWNMQHISYLVKQLTSSKLLPSPSILASFPSRLEVVVVDAQSESLFVFSSLCARSGA